MLWGHRERVYMELFNVLIGLTHISEKMCQTELLSTGSGVNAQHDLVSKPDKNSYF
jgi:hypothetical protein